MVRGVWLMTSSKELALSESTVHVVLVSSARVDRKKLVCIEMIFHMYVKLITVSPVTKFKSNGRKTWYTPPTFVAWLTFLELITLVYFRNSDTVQVEVRKDGRKELLTYLRESLAAKTADRRAATRRRRILMEWSHSFLPLIALKCQSPLR